MRPIDADALLYCLEKVQEEFLDNGNYIAVCITKTVIKLLKTEGAIPTIDVEPVRHGRWIKPSHYPKWICGECNKWVWLESATAEMNYCPNCGAKMDVKEE